LAVARASVHGRPALSLTRTETTEKGRLEHLDQLDQAVAQFLILRVVANLFQAGS